MKARVSQLHVLTPEPSIGSYKVICSWYLSILGLEMPGRGCAMKQGWLPLVLGLETLNKKYSAY